MEITELLTILLQRKRFLNTMKASTLKAMKEIRKTEMIVIICCVISMRFLFKTPQKYGTSANGMFANYYSSEFIVRVLFR